MNHLDQAHLKRRNMQKFCDGDCNHCPMVNHPNSRMLTKVLNELYSELGNKVYEIVQANCPNFTVCYDCRIDDFCHRENCKIILAIPKKEQ